MRIVIPGGAGQVGTVLARHFCSQGHDVTVLTRHPAAMPWRTLAWDGKTRGDWTDSLDGADVCINLAGRTVNCRYNASNRAEILNSRVDSTRILGQVIGSLAHPPRVWLNASTATIYRHELERPNDEFTGILGGDERRARPIPGTFPSALRRHGKRLSTKLPRRAPGRWRCGPPMTFSPDPGGVFDVFLSLVRRGLGGAVGPGTQYVSWIHDADFIRATEFLIGREEMDGAVNLASPSPLPNREFQRVLREAWGTRVGLPTTEWMIEIGTFLMRTESELVLKSRRVVPGRLLSSGFSFSFPTWPEAARDLVDRWRANHEP